MEWFEYIIMFLAIGLVILPFVLNKKNKKKGKCSCGGDCGCCHISEDCKKVFEEIRQSNLFGNK